MLLKTILVSLFFIISISTSFIAGMKWQAYNAEIISKRFFDYGEKTEQEKQQLQKFFDMK